MMVDTYVLSQQPIGNFDALPEEEQRALINCHSYKKYWWYRKIFEQHLCPLCIRPREIYPELFRTNHWIVVDNTLAETEGRKRTFLIINNEHLCWLDWNSLYASPDNQRVIDKIYRITKTELHEHGGMVFYRIGDGLHSVDTAPGHCHQTFIIPDGTMSISIPAFKGPHRHEEITERALLFRERYEAGEIPT